jgi:hypothetical protein
MLLDGFSRIFIHLSSNRQNSRCTYGYSSSSKLGLDNLTNSISGWRSIQLGRIPLTELVTYCAATLCDIHEASLLIRINKLYRHVMSSEELHRIFEPFYSTKGRTGMGLPLVRQIITEHMGEVILESTLGVGTTVQFIFPVRWKEE